MKSKSKKHKLEKRNKQRWPRERNLSVRGRKDYDEQKKNLLVNGGDSSGCQGVLRGRESYGECTCA